MKTAEFLNTKANYMLQVLPEHAGDDPESGLIRVPDSAEKATLCNGYLIFWKDSKYSFSIKEESKWCYKLNDDSVYFDFNEYMRTYGDSEIIWQRNTLQQKVDEVRQHLGLTSNDKLSVMIGREESYLRKLLKRKVSKKTSDKVIAELDALKTSGNNTPACSARASQSALKSNNDLLLIALLDAENSKLKREIDSQLNMLKVSDNNVEFWRKRYKNWKNTAVALFFGFIIVLIALASVPLWSAL